MSNDPKRHQEEITISLESKESEVDAEAVASMIRAITAIVAETQRELNANEQILVKARPFSKGSFEIPLDLVLVSAASLFDTPIILQNMLETMDSQHRTASIFSFIFTHWQTRRDWLTRTFGNSSLNDGA